MLVERNSNFFNNNIIFLITVILFFGNFFIFFSGNVTIFEINFAKDFFEKFSLKYIFETLRANYALISLVINIIIFIYLISVNKLNKNLINIILLSILLILPQIIGLFNNILNYKIIDQQSITYSLHLTSTAFNIFNLFFLRDSKYTKYIFFFPLVCLSLQYFIFFSNYSFLQIQYGGFPIRINLLDTNYNFYFNSNGLGRTTSIFYIFSIIYFFNVSDFKKKMISLILCSISLIFILLLSGRFNILCLIIISSIILFYNKDFIIRNFFRVLIYIFAILIIVHGTELYKKEILKKDFKGVQLKEELKKFETNSLNFNILRNSVPQSNSNIINKYTLDQIDNNYLYGFVTKLNNLSTGRLIKWIFIIQKNEKYFLGQGPNMDRKFFQTEILKIDKNKSNHLDGANDSASGILYTHISSGILGIISIIIFFISILIILIKERILFDKSNILLNVYLFIFLFLSLRIFFEIGYFIHGIDYLLLMLFILIINIEKKKIN